MPKLSVYDPPMCCSTGVCGPAVDPVLPRVAADLDWLKRQGVEVERYNLAQQPQAFATNPAVTAILREEGNGCLPLILLDGQVVARGGYPDRAELARWVGLSVEPGEAGGEASGESEGACCSLPQVVVVGGKAAGSSQGCC
jgi:hypothetical protein